MLKKLLFVLVFFVFIDSTTSVDFVKANTSTQSKDYILVATFNVGDRRDVTDRSGRMNNLATFLTNTGTDIALLQEFNNQNNRQDQQLLVNHLLSKGNSLANNVYSVNYHQDQSRGFSDLLLLSKYPLDDNTKLVNYLRTDRSIQTVVTTTPLGNIKFTNFHAHHSSPCEDIAGMQQITNQWDKNNHVLGGDLNVGTGRDGKIKCPDFIIDKEAYSAACTEEWDCVNKDNNPIDQILIRGDSNLYIERSKYIGDPYGISDSHPMITAIIRTTSTIPSPTTPAPSPTPTPNQSPTPTPAQTPNPTPTYSKYDTNRDGVVTIIDAITVIRYIFQ